MAQPSDADPSKLVGQRIERVESAIGSGLPAAERLAVLIPIRKTDSWWAIAQDERRAILEDQSHHIAVGLEYLPAVARRLHPSRELGEQSDFLTWFEYAPEQAEEFEKLMRRLRRTPEWKYVDREVYIRLTHAARTLPSSASSAIPCPRNTLEQSCHCDSPGDFSGGHSVAVQRRSIDCPILSIAGAGGSSACSRPNCVLWRSTRTDPRQHCLFKDLPSAANRYTEVPLDC